MKNFKLYKFTLTNNVNCSGYSDIRCSLCGQYAFDGNGKCMNCGNYIGY